MQWIVSHKLMTILLVVALAGVVWYFLGDNSSTTTGVLVADGITPLPEDTQRLVQSLTALRTVSLDGEVFQSPAFEKLQDFSSPIVPEPVGRANPFTSFSTRADVVVTEAASL